MGYKGYVCFIEPNINGTLRTENIKVNLSLQLRDWKWSAVIAKGSFVVLNKYFPKREI